MKPTIEILEKISKNSRNNKEEKCAEVIRLIFKLFTEGMGYKRIAQYLYENSYQSPAYYQKLFYNKGVPYTKTKIGQEYIWNPRSVQNIIENEQYCGILICNKYDNNKILKKRMTKPEDEHFRHEGVYPRIISDEIWKMSLAIREGRKDTRCSPNNKRIYRYSGLLRCQNCNASFTAKKRKIIGDEIELEYV